MDTRRSVLNENMLQILLHHTKVGSATRSITIEENVDAYPNIYHPELRRAKVV